MKSLKIVTLLCLAMAFVSCEDNDPIVLEPVASETVSNLFAPVAGGGQGQPDEGPSFGTVGEPERTGDAAAYFTTNGFASLTEVDETLLIQDGTTGYAIPTGGGNGWYDYTPFPINLITPRAGVVLVFRTTEGKFAKVQVESYYQNAPATPDSTTDVPRYYTFNYVYQPNDLTTFE